MEKQLEQIVSSFQKWCLRKNIIASSNEAMPIIFIRDTAHCSHIEFELRQSKKRYSIEIEFGGRYSYYKYKKLTIYYININENYINEIKGKIKDFICEYIKIKKQITTYKFKNINKVCVDLIDNENIYLNRDKNIIIKSIISKTEIIDYNDNTHKIEDLFIRYI